MSTEILKVEEGKKRLARIEAAAGEHFHNSEREFGKAIVGLLEIQADRLWEYAEDEDGVLLRDIENASFETYLRIFCNRYGISRSSTQSYMGVGRLWIALGRDPAELVNVGIHRAKYVENLIGYDGRKNEFRMPPASVVAKLPDEIGSSGDMVEEELPPERVIEMVNRKIDEVLILPAEPLTDDDVRDSFNIDVDETKSKTWFFFAKDSGDVWFGYETMDDAGDGKLMKGGDYEALPQPIRDRLKSSLRIKTYN